MKVLLLWADDASPNLGVRVLAAGTTAVVRDVWPDAAVDCFSANAGAGGAPHVSVAGLVQAASLRRGALSDWLGSYDLVIDTGAGDSFADIYGLKRLATFSGMRVAAAQAGVPVILGPQTIGPFRSSAGRLLGRHSLRAVAAVFARDYASRDYATDKLGVSCLSATDVVFALPVNRGDGAYDVIVNVSGLLWNANPHVDHESYQEACESLCRALLASGRQVSLLVHVLENPTHDTDADACYELQRRLVNAVDVLEPVDLGDARRIISGGALVVGARMHACLNALSQGVPTIPWAYSRKFAPLLSDVGWPHVVQLDAADVVGDTLSLASALAENGASEAAEAAAQARSKLATLKQALAGMRG